MTLFENKLGAYQACESLADIWSITTSPCYPESQLQLDSASLPITPAVDPSPSLTPTSSPSLFAGIHKNNSRRSVKRQPVWYRVTFSYTVSNTRSSTCFWCHRQAKDLQCTKEMATWEFFNGFIWLIKLKKKLDESPQQCSICNLWDANLIELSMISTFWKLKLTFDICFCSFRSAEPKKL